MAKKTTEVNWDEDTERLILYMDIMGFSNRETKNTHEKLKADLLSFTQTWKKRIKPLELGNHLKNVQFSDTILIVVDGIDKQMFNLISKAAVCLMQVAIKLGFPIKGVIAQGQFSYDEQNELYFGLPLVEAYQLHDEIYYYGIVVHHSAEATIKKYTDRTNPYTKTPILLKKGQTSHYHLSWHLVSDKLDPGNIECEVKKWLGVIEEQVSGAPRIYVDNTIKVIESDSKKWKSIKTPPTN